MHLQKVNHNVLRSLLTPYISFNGNVSSAMPPTAPHTSHLTTTTLETFHSFSPVPFGSIRFFALRAFRRGLGSVWPLGFSPKGTPFHSRSGAMLPAAPPHVKLGWTRLEYGPQFAEANLHFFGAEPEGDWAHCSETCGDVNCE